MTDTWKTVAVISLTAVVVYWLAQRSAAAAPPVGAMAHSPAGGYGQWWAPSLYVHN